MIKPYYVNNNITLYLGDCREILPQLSFETVITDPVWPDSSPQMHGSDNPYQIFKDMCESLPADTQRLIVQLGCDSDPRFLSGVPKSWQFLRVCWLEYVKPSYKGRILYSGDVAYVFGLPPEYKIGRQLLPGKCISTKPDKLFLRRTWIGSNVKRKCYTRDDNHGLLHPCPRRLQHVEWLVDKFSDQSVCDPFMGSGTTGVAAKKLGRRFIGIEIDESYMKLAIDRIQKQELSIQDELNLINE